MDEWMGGWVDEGMGACVDECVVCVLDISYGPLRRE